MVDKLKRYYQRKWRLSERLALKAQRLCGIMMEVYFVNVGGCYVTVLWDFLECLLNYGKIIIEKDVLCQF